MEGAPGWSLERRDDHDPAPGYATWPAGAKFRAAVDPEAFSLAAPERFYTRGEFARFVRALVGAVQAKERPSFPKKSSKRLANMSGQTS